MCGNDVMKVNCLKSSQIYFDELKDVQTRIA
jgi:hypothetical protein